jgi:hypothetical protein
MVFAGSGGEVTAVVSMIDDIWCSLNDNKAGREEHTSAASLSHR